MRSVAATADVTKRKQAQSTVAQGLHGRQNAKQMGQQQGLQQPINDAERQAAELCEAARQ